MNTDKKKEIKETVKKGYGEIARSSSSCCSSSCCGGDAGSISKSIGYSDDEITAAPEGSNLGLGCGNPVALASLQEGETVLDLGSGAGFDSFLAAERVGAKGRVIGVDMTGDMVEKARINAQKTDLDNVEFRQGEIEELPLEDNSVDVIISNCVINLSGDKEKVFTEAFRVLKGGGRLMVSDIVLLKDLPEAVMASSEAYLGCIAGASMKDEYIKYIKDAGFGDVEIISQSKFSLESINSNFTGEDKLPANSVESISVRALKPVTKSK